MVTNSGVLNGALSQAILRATLVGSRYTHTHTHTHTWAHTCTHTCTHAHAHTHMTHTHTHAHTHDRKRARAHTHTQTHRHTYTRSGFWLRTTPANPSKATAVTGTYHEPPVKRVFWRHHGGYDGIQSGGSRGIYIKNKKIKINSSDAIMGAKMATMSQKSCTWWLYIVIMRGHWRCRIYTNCTSSTFGLGFSW